MIEEFERHLRGTNLSENTIGYNCIVDAANSEICISESVITGRFISFEVTHGTLPFQNCGFDIEGVLPLLKTPNDERRAQAQFSGISNVTSSSIQTSSEPRFS